MAALDSAAVSLPLILGSTVILYAQVSPTALSSGVLAAFLGVAWVTLLTSRSCRPIAYTTRFFEAATLATLVLEMASRLPRYGLQDTEAMRLGLLCGMTAMAGLVAGLLWILRAERLARFIPAPVYSGFASSIAVSIGISQWQSLTAQMGPPQQGWQVAAAVATVMVSAFAVKRFRPRWPASALGLISGISVGLLMAQTDNPLPRLIESQSWSIPLQLADFTGLWGPAEHRWQWWLDLIKGSTLLGVLVFLNNVVTGEQLAQLDDRRTLTTGDKGLQALA
ncbi:MAG: SulP family inorganic anion transporter, partial [Giesbergeria sp.]|nr:SulP family inorganic anion transporter [Giesbergeria sp.]